VSNTRLGPTTRFLLLSDSSGFVDVGHPIRREDGSVVYNCCWPSPGQSFSGPSPVGVKTIFCCPDSRLPQPGGPGPCIYIPQEQGSPVILPGTGFPFHRLLRLAEVFEPTSTRTAAQLTHCSNSSAYNILARTAQKTPFLCCSFHCCVRVYWDPHVIATQSLPSNGCCLQSHYLATAVV
jgi:hypothetical protein